MITHQRLEAGHLRFDIGSSLQVQAIQCSFSLAREIPGLADLPTRGGEAVAELEYEQLSVGGSGAALQILLYVGVFALGPVQRSQGHLVTPGGKLAPECGVEDG